MFEDKIIRQTKYGKLIEIGNSDVILVTKEGEEVMDYFYEGDFERWIRSLFGKTEGAPVKRFSAAELGIEDVLADIEEAYEEDDYIPDLMLKLPSWPHLQEGNTYGILTELITIAEIQKYMAERGNKGENYEFVPYRLYFATTSFILTEWVNGRDWAHLEIEEYPGLSKAMREFRKDLEGTGLRLDTSDGNLIYLGKNEKSGKPKFTVIDQLDLSLQKHLD